MRVRPTAAQLAELRAIAEYRPGPCRVYMLRRDAEALRALLDAYEEDSEGPPAEDPQDMPAVRAEALRPGAGLRAVQGEEVNSPWYNS